MFRRWHAIMDVSENVLYSRYTRVTHSWPIYEKKLRMDSARTLRQHMWPIAHTFFRFQVHRGVASSGCGAFLVQALWANMFSPVHGGNLQIVHNPELMMIWSMFIDKWSWVPLSCTHNITRSCSCVGNILFYSHAGFEWCERLWTQFVHNVLYACIALWVFFSVPPLWWRIT